MPSKVAPVLLRKINERRVMEVIRHQGPLSRAAVVRKSGLTAPTVSKAVASLMERGLLEERDRPNSGIGRPAKILELASEQACVVGVVIDAPKCWVGVVGLDGRIDPAYERSFPLASTYAELITTIQRHVEELTAKYETAPRGIGLCVPGLVNSSLRQVVFSPNLHLLDGHQPGVDLTDRLGVSCLMLQESHALCLGERMFGAAHGLKNFAMLDVSTGLGLGVMSGGQLLSGQSGLAGELGHVTVEASGARCGCGNLGCLETVATDSALCRLVSAKLGRLVRIDEVIELTRTGQLDAISEVDRTCEYLAIAIAAVINIFNPSILFVHGRLFGLGDGLFSRLEARARERALKPSQAECQILLARGSKRQGAVAGILQHLTDSLVPAWM